MKRLNQNGLSLMEVVVSLAVLGILTLGSMRLLETTNKSMGQFEKSSEVLAIESQITSYLLSKNGCMQLVGSNPGDSLNIRRAIQSYDEATKSVKVEFDKVIYSAGKEISKVRIENIRLMPFIYLEDSQEAAIAPVEISITAKDSKHQFSANSRTYKKQIPVPVGIDATTAQIKDCNLERAALYEVILDRLCSDSFGLAIDVTCIEAILEVHHSIKEQICNDLTGSTANYDRGTDNAGSGICDLTRTHLGKSCPNPNEFAYGFNSDGEIQCR